MDSSRCQKLTADVPNGYTDVIGHFSLDDNNGLFKFFKYLRYVSNYNCDELERSYPYSSVLKYNKNVEGLQVATYLSFKRDSIQYIFVVVSRNTRKPLRKSPK